MNHAAVGFQVLRKNPLGVHLFDLAAPKRPNRRASVKLLEAAFPVANDNQIVSTVLAALLVAAAKIVRRKSGTAHRILIGGAKRATSGLADLAAIGGLSNGH